MPPSASEVERDADDHLIGAEPRARSRAWTAATAHARRDARRAMPSMRRAGRVADRGGGERAEQQLGLEREIDHAGALGDRAAHRREHVRHRDPEHLRDEREREDRAISSITRASARRTHGPPPRPRARRRPAASRSAPWARGRRPRGRPTDRKPSTSAATATPIGCMRPSSAAEMPRKPVPRPRPSSNACLWPITKFVAASPASAPDAGHHERSARAPTEIPAVARRLGLVADRAPRLPPGRARAQPPHARRPRRAAIDDRRVRRAAAERRAAAARRRARSRAPRVVPSLEDHRGCRGTARRRRRSR